MIRTLQQRAVQIGIDVFMECTVTELLQEDDGNGGGRISGVFGYWRETGRFVTIEAPSVILATGGIGKAYKVTSNSWEYTGDGHALALRAGASLINMEFVQFHPTGMVWPPSVKGCSSPSRCAATAASSRTPMASGSCSTTSPSSSRRRRPTPRRRPTAGTRTRRTRRPRAAPA